MKKLILIILAISSNLFAANSTTEITAPFDHLEKEKAEEDNALPNLSQSDAELLKNFTKFISRKVIREAFTNMNSEFSRVYLGWPLGIYSPEEHLAGILNGSYKNNATKKVFDDNNKVVDVDAFKYDDPIRAYKKGDASYGEMSYTPSGRVFRSIVNRVILNAFIMHPMIKAHNKLYDSLENLLTNAEDRNSLKYISKHFSMDPTLVALHPDKYFVGEKIEDYDSETYLMWAVMLVKKITNELSGDFLDASEDFVVRLSTSFLGFKDYDEEALDTRSTAEYFYKVLYSEIFKETVSKPFIYGSAKKFVQNTVSKKTEGLLPIKVVQIGKAWHKVYAADEISSPQMVRILKQRFDKILTPEEVAEAGMERGPRVIPNQTLTQRLLDNGYNLPSFTYSLLTKVAGTYLFFAWVYPAMPGTTMKDDHGKPILDVNGYRQPNSLSSIKLTRDYLAGTATYVVLKKVVDTAASYVQQPLQRAKESYEDLFKALVSSRVILTQDQEIRGVMRDGEAFYYVF